MPYVQCMQVGPEHIDTSGGYFQLGNVFYSMNKVENALAMYDKVREHTYSLYVPYIQYTEARCMRPTQVVDIWYKCVTQLLSSSASSDGAGGGGGAELPPLGDAKGAEGVEVRICMHICACVHTYHRHMRMQLARDRRRC